MIEIEDMSDDEIRELLSQTEYGHLGCSRNDIPYIVPIHYAYSEPNLYIYTTEGKKVEIIRSNPLVCLQVERVANKSDWESVIVTGKAVYLDDSADRERAVDLIKTVNPTLTPAVSIHWLDDWIRENREAVYRIQPRTITGRKTVRRRNQNAVLISTAKRREQNIC